jgi:hypothetical protein
MDLTYQNATGTLNAGVILTVVFDGSSTVLNVPLLLMPINLPLNQLSHPPISISPVSSIVNIGGTAYTLTSSLNTTSWILTLTITKADGVTPVPLGNSGTFTFVFDYAGV